MTAPFDRLAAALGDRYRLERELGQGGMATVYLAEDLRHGRKVAIKLLHPELSAIIGGERFLAEIRVTAQLQHPHILGLIDSGSADGLLYYVMPYVAGEALRGRLQREKQLPVEDALRIAREVAGALDHAHRQGVVHRDIKPENILLQDGAALVADFGIALAVQHAGGSRMTQTGMSLGTPAYMAPEQAMGEREISPRADVYALGAMTYEMLAGEPPFTGTSAQAIVAKVLTEEPVPIVARRRTVPRHVEAAVLRALQKLPADRPASAGEFARALDDASGAHAVAGRTVALPAVRRAARARALAPWLVTAVATAVASWALLRSRAPVAPTVPSVLTIGGTGGASSAPGTARLIDISRDGRTVAYLQSDLSSLGGWMLHDLHRPDPRFLEGSEGAIDLRFLPDGRRVLKGLIGGSSFMLPVTGGAPTPLSGYSASPFVAFGPDGSTWINDPTTGLLLRVDARGVVDSAPVPNLSGVHLIQSILPGGRTALVLTYASANEGQAGLLDLRTGATRPVLDHPVVELRYAAGHLVFVRADGALFAAPFDPGTARLTAPAVQIGRDVAQTGANVAQFAVADNGTIVYAPQRPSELVEVSRDGAERVLADERRNFHSPSYSPDGLRVAVDFPAVGGRDVWTVDREDGTVSRVTSVGDGHDPVWWDDGRIAFTAIRDTLRVLLVRPGDERLDTLIGSPRLSWTGSPLGPGRGFLTTGPSSAQGNDLLRVDEQGAIATFLGTQFDEGWPTVSRDGRWVAFVSNLSGRPEVYVRPAQGEGPQVQVSQRGGTEPVWSRDGRELFYISLEGGRNALWSATVEAGTSFRVRSRTRLFAADRYASAQPHANYDVSPDGRHFAMVKRGDTAQLVVIQGLAALVAERSGVAR